MHHAVPWALALISVSVRKLDCGKCEVVASDGEALAFNRSECDANRRLVSGDVLILVAKLKN